MTGVEATLGTDNDLLSQQLGNRLGKIRIYNQKEEGKEEGGKVFLEANKYMKEKKKHPRPASSLLDRG